jgi:hypothetical protein
VGTYVVRPGEYLEQIAVRARVSADAIWNDPRNAPLRALGRTPTQLHPGDVLVLPDAPPSRLVLTVGSFNGYTARVPMVKVPLSLMDDDGPLRDQPFVVEGLGAPLEGVTDGEGLATFEVPVHVREVTVFLPARGLRFQIAVGDLDPITEPSGVYARLVNLGYARGGGTPSALDQQHAIADFQRAEGLSATGEVDDATRQRLAEVHGT